MIDRFLYHAFTTGVAGRITAPFQEIIPAQASCALPGNGGFASARTDGFRFRDVLSFASAHAVVAGSYSREKDTHSALATVTVEGLDILGMVTADRIVCRVASSHPGKSGAPHALRFTGSHFENLRIAGYRVEVDLAMDRYSVYDTAAALRDAYKNNAEFRGEFDRTALVGYKGAALPPRVQKYLPWAGAKSSGKIPESQGMISCSLVRKIEGMGSELEQYSHIVVVKGFGIIRLAEFHISDSARKLSMLQFHLGCTPEGDGEVGTAEGNGTEW